MESLRSPQIMSMAPPAKGHFAAGLSGTDMQTHGGHCWWKRELGLLVGTGCPLSGCLATSPGCQSSLGGTRDIHFACAPSGWHCLHLVPGVTRLEVEGRPPSHMLCGGCAAGEGGHVCQCGRGLDLQIGSSS
ncbi:hypothetical protein H1C71_035006 [Ictidomys tridecemlineatus]|nr:hypothetical protein H1C71_035006 [Ictidomys tridecemlineatus]KAG3267504.1 hypothetical protein H1C71_035006 [Ictidomys tridecemlineatus]KAG3267505.1 hypothetical protein H1C71_035006 [Ictidomys tridecemlineatus]KAG3267506.1 hypothetical protein H1C71_035006 [Ictidomys tridecemlineatus]